MTQPGLDFQMLDPATFRDRVAAHFRSHPCQWVNAETLMQIGGRMAWRTRVSGCRTQLGMRIENRCRRVGKYTVSEYRFVGDRIKRSADGAINTAAPLTTPRDLEARSDG